MKISVVIPFHNGLDEMQKCLRALAIQTYPAGDFEVIAVDNGSTEDVGGIKSAFPNVVWLVESHPGSYVARNRGVRQAKGEIIAFTDADCLPAASWLQEVDAAFDAGGATIVGGRIDYLNPQGRDLNLCERFEEEFFLLDRQRHLIEEVGVAATANVAARRAVFDRVGLFDPDLKSMGDGEWIKRATARGEILRYADSAVVSHPRRSTFLPIFRKVRRIAGGRVVLMRKRKESAAKLIADFCRYSIFNPRMHSRALGFPKVGGWAARIRMFFLVEFLSLTNSFEKIRVWLGWEAYRG